MMQLNSMNKAIVLMYALVTTIIFSLLMQPSASALSGSQFEAGRIIDDAIFYNPSAMSPVEIQAFLDSKIPVCDTNGTQIYSGSTTRAVYGASQGYPAPYTCINQYSETIDSIDNNPGDLCEGDISAGLKSAASLIYDVSLACEINPQVLIVLLQKEQSLITDDWPWDSQYRIATGYGCPDTAPCDEDYYGFFNQIYNAAKAFRRYEANPGLYNYVAEQDNYIYYHPSLGACGGSTIFVENQATANLYIYTPYQPNQSALDNLYGSGDSCGAYGNRNFWRMFNDWFGSTYAGSYSHTPTAAGSNVPTGSLVQGDKAYITFSVRNTGNTTWEKSNTFLGTAEPYDRTSTFHDSTWLAHNRVTAMDELIVEPGDTATFSFWYAAPYTTGNYSEKFSVVIEGIAWTPYNGLYLGTTITSPDYSASVVSLGSYKDETLVSGMHTNNMLPGESAYIVLRVRNKGNRVWTRSSFTTRLATTASNGRSSVFNKNWLSASRVTNMIQKTVAPGQIANFHFWYQAPTTQGSYNEKFTLVHEGRRWSNYFGFHLNTNVVNPTFSAQPVASGSSIPTDVLSKGEKAWVVFKVKNTGNFTWTNMNTRLGTAEDYGRISTFNYNWPTANRASNLQEDAVGPGEVGTFGFWYRAPNNTGSYVEHFTPVVEGYTWIPYSGLFLSTEVTE
jgi:hypothetical protein